MNYPLFSSESVCAGHPDKICDQISDAVLDAALSLDKNSRVAVETLVTVDKIVLAGEVTCNGQIDYEKIAGEKVSELGYVDEALGFGPKNSVEVYVHHQSADIALGVDKEGAGDQGMMFGYASNETESLMPLPIVLAHELCRRLDDLQSRYKWIRPDGKSQVTVGYENGKPRAIEKVVLAKPINYGLFDGDLNKFFYKNVVGDVLEKIRL